MNTRFKSMLLAVLLVSAAPAFADGIEITDAYARSNTPIARAGGAFMEITNTGDAPDRLLSVATDIARNAQIHENIFADGVASMRELTSGIVIRPGATIRLMRGGDHIMLMGLGAPLKEGGTVPLILTFEQAGDIKIDVPVDLGKGAGGH